MDRIIGAFTFRSGVYSEVEHDSSFTTTAWILVAIVGFVILLIAGGVLGLLGLGAAAAGGLLG